MHVPAPPRAVCAQNPGRRVRGRRETRVGSGCVRKNASRAGAQRPAQGAARGTCARCAQPSVERGRVCPFSRRPSSEGGVCGKRACKLGCVGMPSRRGVRMSTAALHWPGSVSEHRARVRQGLARREGRARRRPRSPAGWVRRGGACGRPRGVGRGRQRARVRVRVRVGARRAPQRRGQGGGGGGGRPSPRSQRPGRLLCQPGTAALPPPPPPPATRAGVTPGPRRALPLCSRLGFLPAQTPLLPGSRPRLRRGRGDECGGGARAGLEERESGRGSGPGAELRCPQTRLPAVRRALHLCHAQPRQVLQAALVLSPGMVSL